MDVIEIFLDFKARWKGIVKALTTDFGILYQKCDPNETRKELLCLYGISSQNWELKPPSEKVPPELPEPTFGINFLTESLLVEDWLHIVAVHSDAWLIAVAFFYVGRHHVGQADRRHLFKLINELPTVAEVVAKHSYVNPILDLTNYTTIKPLRDRILIKIEEAERKTQTMPLWSGVVAAGEGMTVGTLLPTNAQTCLETGAHVLYSKCAGTQVTFNGEKHIFVKHDDIVGIIETDDIVDLIPLNDIVLIKVEKVEKKIPGGLFLRGLFITETTKEKPFVGTVIRVGPELLDRKDNIKDLSVTPGKTVLCSKYTGKEIKSKDGFDYIPLRSSDVVAILS